MSIEQCIFELKNWIYNNKSNLRVDNYFCVIRISDTPVTFTEYLKCNHLLLFKRYFGDLWEDDYNETKLLIYLLEVIISILHTNNIKEIKLENNLFAINTNLNDWILVSNLTNEIIYDFRTKKDNQGYIYVRPKIR